MNWDAWGAIGELIGAAAVVATLIYLSLQVRQNSAAIRSSTRSDIAKEQTALNFFMAQNPDLSLAAYAYLGGDEVDQKSKIAAEQLLAGGLRAFENQYFAYLEGNFTESVWLGYRSNVEWAVRQPRFPEFWADRGKLFSAEFRDFVNSIREDLPR